VPAVRNAGVDKAALDAVLGTYRAGATVVSCGSTDWVFGLAGGDPLVERVTRNALDRLAG